jgi:glycosyltransferase involved in cell wall biosynthesis
MLRLNARHIVTVSSFSRDRIVKHLHIDESRISIVRNAVDHFDRIEREPSILTRLDLVADRYVLFVGSLAVSKNLARVLSAIKLLDGGRDFKFVIVGRANPRVFSGKHQEVEDLPPDVVMAGAVSDEELKSLYENAGCFLFPSLYEGFGLPPLEAMYCGCPVIVSREASLPEVCGDAAMYCDAYSVADIAHKITNMMGDANLRDRYRLLGREHARQYRWDVSARALLGVLDKIAP